MSGTVFESPRAQRVTVEADRLVVSLVDGREIAVPLAWFPRLLDASPTERARYRLIGGGMGIHWSDVDEDISVPALLSPSRGDSVARTPAGGAKPAAGNTRGR